MAEDKKTETKELALPDHLTVGKAAALVGADKAEAFFNEVMFAGWGNLSDHASPELPIKGLVEAANDQDNSQKALAQDSLRKVTAVFKQYVK